MDGTLILAYDIGTTSLKACLYDIGDNLSLRASAMAEYRLTILENGGAEQNPEDWYKAMISTTRRMIEEHRFEPGGIAGISFCSQMQGLVLVDREGRALRPAMSYMDGRAAVQKARSANLKGRPASGPRIEGLPAEKLLNAIRITGIAPTSVKDPLWKYHWVRDNEPDIFSKVYKYLDVKEFLIMRLTGRAVMTRDSAGATGLYDNRSGRGCWSKALCRAFGMNPEHLPDIIDSDAAAGTLLPGIASDLGLESGIPVFGGGGDASLIGLGAGAVKENDIHIYMGTSGWVSACTSRRRLDLKHMIASITGAVPGMYNYFCEQETAGKCMEWVAKHLALDEIGVYLQKKQVDEDPESIYNSLFEYLSEVVADTEAGCGGVLFTPWLHGSRSPFEDPNARGMFFNIGLNTGKRKMIRAVVEGLGYNLRWMLESLESGMKGNDVIRFVGGGAQSNVTAQILADITGRTIEVPDNPQNTGALGAAVLAGIGLGRLGSFDEIPQRIGLKGVFIPSDKNSDVYERNYSVFRRLYSTNKILFNELNKGD